MKIDYDELRKLAEAAERGSKLCGVEWLDVYIVRSPHQDYIRAMSPAVTLRLLEIIDVAKGALRNARQCHCIDGNPRRDCPAVITQKAFVEIAKLENGE